MTHGKVTMDSFSPKEQEVIREGFAHLQRLDNETPEMTKEEFSQALDLLYGGSDSLARDDLGFSDTRTIRRYRSGERRIPPGLARELRAFVSLKEPKESTGPDYLSVIAQLQKAGEESGMPAKAVAGAILGSAKANALRLGLHVEINIPVDNDEK